MRPFRAGGSGGKALRERKRLGRSFPRSAWECINGRSASALEWDAERPGLHSFAARGNDQSCCHNAEPL